MNKVTNYQNIIIDFLKEQAAPTLGINPSCQSCSENFANS